MADNKPRFAEILPDELPPEVSYGIPKPRIPEGVDIIERDRLMKRFRRDVARAKKTAPKEGDPDLNPATAAAITFARDAPLGWGDKLAATAATAATYPAGMIDKVAGTDLTGFADDGGYTIGKSNEKWNDKFHNWGQAAEQQQPLTSFLGSLGGAILGGKKFGEGVTKTVEATKTGRKTMAAANKWQGRLAGQSAVGAGEGVVYALGSDKPIAVEALYGIGGGLGGQLISEVFTGFKAWNAGKPTVADKQKAVDNLHSEIVDAAGGAGAPPAQYQQVITDLVDEVDRLGPQATIADVAPYLEDIVTTTRQKNLAATSSFTYFAKERAAGDKFVDGMQEFLAGKAPRSPAGLKRSVKAMKEPIKAEFDRAFQNPKFKYLNVGADSFSKRVVDDNLFRGFEGDQLTVMKPARKRLNAVLADNVLLKDGTPAYTVKRGKLVSNLPDGQLPPALKAKTVHAMRIEVDELLRGAYAGKNKMNATAIRSLTKVRRKLTEQLNQNPDFKAASEHFKNVEDYQTGYTAGYDALGNKKITAEDYAMIFHESDDAGKLAMTEGATARLSELYKADPLAFAKLVKDNSGGSYFEKLKLTFGDEAVKAIINNADRSARFNNMADLMVSAGRTRPNVRQGTDVGAAADAGIMSQAVNPTSSLSTSLIGGAARRQASKFVDPKIGRIDNAMMEIMEQLGPDAQRHLLDLKSKAGKRAPMRGDNSGAMYGAPTMLTAMERLLNDEDRK